LQANLKVNFLSKWPVITTCISLAAHHNLMGRLSGELTKSILPNTVTTATLHLRDKQ